MLQAPQMRNIVSVIFALSMVLFAAMLSGCGGGNNNPPANLVNLTGTDTLSSNDSYFSGSHRYYHTREITATRNGYITVMMARFGNGLNDPYIIVANGSGLDSPVLATNDDFNNSKDSKLTFTAIRGHVYTIVFTTYGGYDVGTYYYIIQEVG